MTHLPEAAALRAALDENNAHFNPEKLVEAAEALLAVLERCSLGEVDFVRSGENMRGMLAVTFDAKTLPKSVDSLVHNRGLLLFVPLPHGGETP